MKNKNIDLKDVIFNSMQNTQDGVVLFDEQDVAIFCNESMADIYSIPFEQVLGQSFSELIRNCFDNNQGLNINTDDVNQWLEQAQSKRRKQEYRSFEVDTVDGRWFLLTEHLVGEQVFVYCTNITEKKQSEIELNKLTKKLERLATTDFLTGIDNRRAFYKKTEQEFCRCQRQGQDMVLMLIDIDNFKPINDRFGHSVGDQVLINFAKTASLQLRTYDTFGRLGGDEFAILLPNTETNNAVMIAERIRDSIEKMTTKAGEHDVSITVSIGIANYKIHSQTFIDIINHADKNLYLSKSHGRNKVYLT